MVVFEIAMSKFKIAFLRLAGYFTVNFYDYRFYACVSKGDFFVVCFLPDTLDTSHLSDDSYDV